MTTSLIPPSPAAAGVPAAADAAPGMESAERIMVMAALAGDDEAFETVIRTYSRRVYVVAYAILQDVSEAEDVVQETFLKAHHQRGKLREPEKFPAWLLTVTRNGARDRLRRRRPQADVATFDTMVDHRAATPGSAMEQEEHQAHLRRALATLPEEHRTALTLRYLEGLDYRAIETAMGLSNGALRGILGRALGTLRRMPGLERSSL
ncbi:MAG TPA: sigma-70 family RNA polymerase sigma factor [Candidatus Methylacidiphilales bacterium]|nr:sigma-70 family RNA polymerase sigma factor [Candidatus Methylacidiphilales bacterium]